MKDLKDIKNLFFLGIGGIGMSALARYFKSLGKNVAGYDKTPSQLTKTLQLEGIPVVFSDEVFLLNKTFIEDKTTLVVYTPAIPKDHKQFNFFLENGYLVEKRAKVLGMATQNIFTLAVAGTHGKTTTTAILAHLLKDSGMAVTAFIGGISENYQSNLILAGNEVMVVEADEFDRSFLQLSPNLAAITSMDADHLDIYGKKEQLQQSFKDFADLLPASGKLFYNKGLPLVGISIGVENNADITVKNPKVENGSYVFDLDVKGELITGFSCGLPGKHNLFNAATALAMAMEYGVPVSKLKSALAGFKGVKRRFSYSLKNENWVLIDDYAHHPAEIAAAHQAIREMHPNKEVLVVFQPHLFSRTRDFAKDFAEELGKFNQVYLLDIYPARENPISGITSAWLLAQIPNKNKKLVSKENLSEEILKSGFRTIMMLGAGDIGEEVATVKKSLENEN